MEGKQQKEGAPAEGNATRTHAKVEHGGEYLPIEDHGIVGNTRTVALVGRNATIDWMCFPHFDSPSIFCSLLDSRKGGHWSICPVGSADVHYKQYYWLDTNVLVTRISTEDGIAQVIDYMPVGDKGLCVNGSSTHNALIRQLSVVHGKMCFKMECKPGFNYARDPHEVKHTKCGIRFSSKSLDLSLFSPVDTQIENGAAIGEICMEEGDRKVNFILCDVEEEHHDVCHKVSTDEVFESTIEYWHKWLSQCTYKGRWREMVHRSALVMKLLTFAPTGAIVAAPTCSLPEELGGVRNWDYRYTWLRDAAFTLYGFLRIGFYKEASAFMSYLEARCREVDEQGQQLQPLYGIHGEAHLPEFELDHLEGYKGSRPVRVGNGAYNQVQMDIYGELLDSVYIYNKFSPISYDLWCYIRKIVDFVADNWHLKDHGMWEVRGDKQHFVYSKVMMWVCLDRGVRLADKYSKSALNKDKWQRSRDQLYEEIMEKGYDQKIQSFVMHYGCDTLDAATLILPLVFFISPTDPRMLATIKCIDRSPDKGGLASDTLVYRYNTEAGLDGLTGGEGTFNMCTFWLIEALSRAGDKDCRKLREAQLKFEEMLTYANHLGLYAEQTGYTGLALGNFPQAFTHLALISAAFNLDKRL